MVNYGMYTFPNLLSDLGNSAWLQPFAFGVLGSLILWVMIKLCERFPTDQLFIINEKVLSKPIGKVINSFIVIYGLMMVTNIASNYLRLVQVLALEHITLYGAGLSFYVVIATIVQGGIKLIARFCMISFFMTVWMVFLLYYPMSKGVWITAFSHLNFQASNWLITFHRSMIAFLGFELVMFIYPYIINKKKAYRDAMLGFWVSIFFYFIVAFSGVVYFSPWQIDHLLYPVFNFFKAVEFSFLERIEILGLSMWIFLILNSCAAFLWLSTRGLDSILSKNKHRSWHLYFLVIVSLFLFLGPIPIAIQELILTKIPVFIAYGIFVWPLFLLFVSTVRKQGKRKNQKQQG